MRIWNYFLLFYGKKSVVRFPYKYGMRNFINIVNEHSLFERVNVSTIIPYVESHVNNICNSDDTGIINWEYHTAPKIFKKMGMENCPRGYNQIIKWLLADGSNAEQFKKEFRIFLIDKLQKNLSKFDGKIYRIMSVDDNYLTKLNGKTAVNIGEYWSHSKDIVDTFLQFSGPKEMKQHEIVFSAKLNDEKVVNWYSYLITSIELNDFEGEFKILPNSPINVEWIELNGNRIDWNCSFIA